MPGFDRGALRGLKRDVLGALRKAAPGAVDAATAVLARGVERRVPVGETHGLADGVRTRPARPTRGGASGSVDVASGHAAAVEFGTSEQAARPFLRPTFDEDSDAAAAAAAAVLKDAL